MENFKNHYRKLAKTEELRNLTYIQYLVNILLSMFEYGGYENDERFGGNGARFFRFLDLCAILNPCGAYGAFLNDSGRFIAGGVTFGRGVDFDGISKTFNIYTLSREHKNNVAHGKDGVIGWNNKAHYSELALIQRYADFLTQIDISEYVTLLNTRPTLGYECLTETERAQIEQFYKSIETGKPFAYVSKNPMAKLGLNGSEQKSVNKMELTNPSDTANLQYLTMFYNDILKRFMFEHGQTMNDSMKKAQQTLGEVTNNDSCASIGAYSMIEERRRFIDAFNKLYNTNITVSFSRAWEQLEKGVIENEVIEA